jgi:hypothetical protein
MEMAMKRKYSYFVIIFSIFLLQSFVVHAGQATYLINKQCNTQPSAKITTITITDDETIIDISFKNNSNKTIIVGIYPPGHDMAFFITDVTHAKKYQLLDFKGVGLMPIGTNVKPGENLKFKLIFEKTLVNRFHVIEGKLPTKGTEWHFSNIVLK